VTIDALAAGQPENQGFLSLEQTLAFYPSAGLSRSAAQKLRFGVPPVRSDVNFDEEVEPNSLVRMMDGEQLLAMARFAPGREKEKRGDFELVRVFQGA